MMSGHTSFVSFYAVFGTLFVDIAVSKNKDSFNAVTSFDELGALYLRMRIREPHLEADETTDIETKRRICQSVATSGFFATVHMDPLDMDTIYLELNSEMTKKKKRKESVANIYYEALLQAYERKSCWRKGSSYRYLTKLITFDVHDSKVKLEEYAFGCALRQRYSHALVIFYVSDAYNINTGLNIPIDWRRIDARFVCVVSQDRCNLAAVAEEPAEAFRSSEYDLEAIYWLMRPARSVAETASDDPVCRLTRAEKLRVCASVMGSSNFANAVKFRAIGGCEKKKVSLLKLNEKEEAAATEVGDYYEWMLTCKVEPVTLAWSTYYVSRAYQSHHAIVYTENYANYYLTENCEYNINSIHANVSVIIDEATDDQFVSPNLNDLLKYYSFSYDSYSSSD